MIVYSLKTLRSVPPRRADFDRDVQYCAGPDDFKGMGIAVVAVYDYVEDRQRVFCADSKQELAALIDARTAVVGFDSQARGNRVLEAAGIHVDKARSYDLLLEVWRALGLNAGNFDVQTHGGYSIVDLARANLLVNGLPERTDGRSVNYSAQWQKGFTGAVVDAALLEAWLLKRLVDRVMVSGLRDPKRPERVLDVRPPNAVVKTELTGPVASGQGSVVREGQEEGLYLV